LNDTNVCSGNGKKKKIRNKFINIKKKFIYLKIKILIKI
jgi:hypothetical protein